MSKSLKKTILFLAVFILFLYLGSSSVFATNVSIPVTCYLNQSSAIEVFNIVNQERAKAGKPALVWDAALENVAMQRAAEIAGFFTHTRPNGQSCFQILQEYGISGNYNAYGENIAWGQTNATEVMNSWMSSQGHRENILSDSYNCIGIARVEENGFHMWIQFFGYNNNVINQNRTNLVGNRTTNVTIADAQIITNLESITFEYNENVSISSFLGDSQLEYGITTTNSELSSGGYGVFITDFNVTSDNSNLLAVSGDNIFASDTGNTNLNLVYQGISKKIPCVVNRPDMNAIIFDYKYYADNNPDLKAAFGYNEGALRNHWESYGKKEGRQASPVFNAQYYLENNSDLKAAFGNNYEAAYNHFINSGIAEFRKSSSEYWGEYYRDNNSDLKEFSNFKLIIHFINSGRNEGRKANSDVQVYSPATAISAIIFNAKFYADINSDLKQAFGYDAVQLSNHWNMYGKQEGRVASPAFDVKYYINNNSDLKQAFGNNYEAAINHFISCGAKEGRVASAIFDVKYYINNNTDLKKAFGEDYPLAYEHFVGCGINEQRKTSSKFDVSIYKNSNSDLLRAFGNNVKSYYMHYLTFGVNENRKCI